MESNVTIAIITCDRPDYLRQAINSALTQTVRAQEVLVVDDGAGNDSEQLISGVNDSRIRYIRTSRPKSGRPAARNLAVSELRTEYLLWLDDDDVMLPTTLESHLEVISNYSDVDVVYGNLIICDQDLNPVGEGLYQPINKGEKLVRFFHTNPVPNVATVISRTCFNRVGKYDDYFVRGQDYDFFARAASLGAKFVHNNSFVCYYRSHSDNAVTKSKQSRFLKYRARVMKNLLDRHSLREMYAWLPWDEFPHVVQFRVCHESAVNFLRFNGYSEAVEVLAKGNIHPFSDIAPFLIEVVNILERESVGILDTCRENRMFYLDFVQNLLDAHLENNYSNQEADDVRAKYIEHRLQALPIEEIYKDLDWEHNAEDSLLDACVDVVGQFVRCGKYEYARETIASALTVKNKVIVEFFMDLITKFESKGISGVSLLKSKPEFYSPRVQNLMVSFGTRKVKEKSEELEGELCKDVEKTESNLNNVIKAKPNSDWTGAISKHKSGYSLSTVSEMLETAFPLLKEAAQLLAGNTSNLHRVGDLARLRRADVVLSPSQRPSSVLFSVIIPTFNRIELLLDAVDSVATQLRGQVEIIIVNDAGEKFDAEFVHALERNNVPITVVCHRENLKLAASRNTGAQHAIGKWLIVLDDDDLLLNNGPQKLLQMATVTDVQLLCGDHRRHYFERGFAVREEHHPGTQNIEEALAIENSRLLAGSFLIKRDLFIALGGYREDMPVQEDYQFMLRAVAGGSIKYFPVPMFVYKIHSRNDRMNVNLRPKWFATSALCHEQYRKTFGGDATLKSRQRINQYRHLANAVSEGFQVEAAKQLVISWWKELSFLGLNQEIALDSEILKHICPALRKHLLIRASSHVSEAI